METINFNNIIVKSSRAACDGSSPRRPPTALTETDVRVLRTLNGQDGGITGWGAAVSASIGWLRGAGYAQGYSNIEITDAGRAALQEQESSDEGEE